MWIRAHDGGAVEGPAFLASESLPLGTAREAALGDIVACAGVCPEV